VSLHAEAAVPSFDGTVITLEHYEVGPDYAEVSAATRRHAFARALDGTSLMVLDR